MRNFLRNLLVILMPVAFLSGSSATFSSSVEQDVTALERSFAAAVKASGVGMEDLLHHDFFYNTINGTSVTKASLISSLGERTVTISDLERSCTRVNHFEDVAIVTAVSNAVVTMDGIERRIGSRYLHVWVRVDGQWRLFSRQVTARGDRATDCES